jgi:hypothetical protein
MARTSNIGAGVSRSADCWRGHYSVVGAVSRFASIWAILEGLNDEKTCSLN